MKVFMIFISDIYRGFCFNHILLVEVTSKSSHTRLSTVCGNT